MLDIINERLIFGKEKRPEIAGFVVFLSFGIMSVFGTVRFCAICTIIYNELNRTFAEEGAKNLRISLDFCGLMFTLGCDII